METEKAFVVWGSGAAQSDLIREARMAEGDEAAVAYDRAEGSDTTSRLNAPDGWCVVIFADPDDVDAATRHDSAIAGYTELREDVLEAVHVAQDRGAEWHELVRAAEAARGGRAVDEE